MNRFTIFMLLLAAALTLLAACGVQRPEPVTFQIEMSEYAFSPDILEVRVGQEVTLQLVNVGNLEHEILLGRQVTMTNNRPSGYQEDMFVTGGVDPVVTGGETETEDGGLAIVLPAPGDRATVTFTVSRAMAGEWEMGCFEQDGVHYDAGMIGTFIVNP